MTPREELAKGAEMGFWRAIFDLIGMVVIVVVMLAVSALINLFAQTDLKFVFFCVASVTCILLFLYPGPPKAKRPRIPYNDHLH